MPQRSTAEPEARPPPREGAAALLIVDSDLSFAFWLGHTLDQAGYVSLPAQSTSSAAELLFLNDLGLEVVVIDSTLPDAAAFVSSLRRAFPRIKTVATVAEGATCDTSAYDTHRVKQRQRDADAAAGWVSFISTLSPPPERLRGGEV